MHEILLVEDSDEDAELLGCALKAGGIRNPVRRISNGTEAMTFLNTREARREPLPSILFLDLKLPGKPGFEILAEIQTRSNFSNVLRIVMSHLRTPERMKRAHDLGAHTFFAKPISRTDLEELMQMYPEYWMK